MQNDDQRFRSVNERAVTAANGKLEFTPTMKLRYLTRTEYTSGNTIPRPFSVKVLQQWWSCGSDGEWRDVEEVQEEVDR